MGCCHSKKKRGSKTTFKRGLQAMPRAGKRRDRRKLRTKGK